MKKILAFILPGLFLLASCEEIDPQYPDTPEIEYQGFDLYISVDQLGNKSIVGKLSFRFTDGDGNVGLYPLADSTGKYQPDSLKYNFFLQLYDLKKDTFEKVPPEEGGVMKYRIPYLDNEPLSGTIDLDISYPVIVHDTIFYTFYIMDRDFNHSNTDTTDVIVLSGIDLEEI
jgi:hypothetical protein